MRQTVTRFVVKKDNKYKTDKGWSTHIWKAILYNEKPSTIDKVVMVNISFEEMIYD